MPASAGVPAKVEEHRPNYHVIHHDTVCHHMHLLQSSCEIFHRTLMELLGLCEELCRRYRCLLAFAMNSTTRNWKKLLPPTENARSCSA